MRSSVSFALLTTYLVVQLFGQVIHTWSDCEHAHLPGRSHTHVHSHDGAHTHSHCHHHCDPPRDESTPIPGDGWNSGHGSGLAADGCLICQHLALGQMVASETDISFERVSLDEIAARSTRLATSKWLGPNSPRAPPVA